MPVVNMGFHAGLGQTFCMDLAKSGIGAVLLLAAPPIMDEPCLGITEEDLHSTEEELRQELDFPVISELSDYLIPKEYFFNTDFHLNDTGRKYRTKRFVLDIKNGWHIRIV